MNLFTSFLSPLVSSWWCGKGYGYTNDRSYFLIAVTECLTEVTEGEKSQSWHVQPITMGQAGQWEREAAGHTVSWSHCPQAGSRGQ